ncbi:GPI mannosyltransferase 2-like isoform X2 [Antedon mediterranea]|uniref:GPI mannosyltransferase 2-like isoform X2 n=1 Tax=Antedon mediterranea TaxID=105859 RepID=UPI003AF7EE0D
MKRKVIKTALVSRVLIIVLQIVFNNLIPDHDADAFHYKSAQKSSFDYDNILKFLTDYISGKNIAIRTRAPSWCDDRPPLLYSYIQNHYWDVGFLKYYQLKKIPNFILAFPMVVICICAVWIYSWKNWNTVKFLEFRKRTSVTIGYMSEAVFVYIVHLCTLVVFATTCINIEVTTRLICSCCPAFYWYVASVIKSKGHLKRKALAKDDHNTISTFYKHFAIDDFNTKLILFYFLSYCVVGVLLHCNFLPWT